MQLDNSYLFAGGTLLAILAAFWSKAKELAWRVMSLMIVRTKFEADASTAFAYWCLRNLKKSRFGERRYEGGVHFVRPANRQLAIAYETIGTDTVTFWRGWRPLFVRLHVPGSTEKDNTGWQLVATTFRGCFNLEACLIEAMDQLNAARHDGEHNSRYGVQRVFGHGRRDYGHNAPTSMEGDSEKAQRAATMNPDRRYLKWKREDIGEPIANDPFAALAYPPEITDVITEISRWLESEAWYKSKSIPWRRGYLLHGKPGTGKTSFVRAIAQELDLPVHAFDLASFSNSDFVMSWRRLMNSVPCIALLEDIDAVFDGRENRLGEEGGSLTFDCLLNCLSGIESADGVLVFVTTNRIECLDDALGVPDGEGNSTRPGRIDRAVELPSLNEECRGRLASMILADYPDEIAGVVALGEGETGAQFSNRCAQLALALYWDDNRVLELRTSA